MTRFTCTLCGRSDWPNDSGCPLCRTETTETMDANTITAQQIREIRILARELHAQCDGILDKIDDGEISPSDAADEINGMIEDITNAAKP